MSFLVRLRNGTFRCWQPAHQDFALTIVKNVIEVEAIVVQTVTMEMSNRADDLF